MTVTGHSPGEVFVTMLSPEDIAAFTERSTPRTFARGHALLYEGQLPDRVLLLISGRVKVYRATSDGREVVLAIRGPGELVGEQAAIAEVPRSASVVAIEKVEAHCLSPAEFVDFLVDRPRAMLALLRMLTRRLRDADDKRVEFTALTTMGRVAMRLVELGDAWGRREGDVIRIALPLSQEELAGFTGASVESVGRAVWIQPNARICCRARREIRILDIDALRHAAA